MVGFGLQHTGQVKNDFENMEITITYTCICYFYTISQKFQEYHDTCSVSSFVQYVQTIAISHRKGHI